MEAEEAFSVLAQERYRHRLSIEAEPLYYMGLIGKKQCDLPLSMH